MSLRELILTEEWVEHAQCAGTDTKIFFQLDAPGKGGRSSVTTVQATALAVSICNACEVREECLEYALDTNQLFGIWGGKTAKERGRIRKQNG